VSLAGARPDAPARCDGNGFDGLFAKGERVSSAVQRSAGASDALARFALRVGEEALDTRVARKVGTHLLDVLGVATVAARQPFAPGVRSVVAGLGGPAEASAIGLATRIAAPNAALANGTFAHGVDYDDTHLAAIVHPSATVIPAALAVAEETDARGGALARACAAGLETAVRIGLAAEGGFHERGFHPTPICGVFGAAMAAGMLYRLKASEMVSSLGLAASMAAGLLEFLTDGTSAKRLHGGWGAHGGIIAARLARAGLSGPAGGIDGRFGLLRTHLGDAAADGTRISRDLSERWEMLDIALKPYPCCHFLHAFLDAARALREELCGPGATAADARAAIARIERIECLVPPLAVPIVCEPLATKRVPQTPYDAQFSLPFAVALMLVRGRATLDDFTPESIRDAGLLDLAARVGYGEYRGSDFARSFPGRVRLHLADGRLLDRDQPDNRGGPGSPLSAAEVEAKFRANAEPLVGEAGASRIVSMAADLDTASARELMAPFARTG